METSAVVINMMQMVSDKKIEMVMVRDQFMTAVGSMFVVANMVVAFMFSICSNVAINVPIHFFF